MKNRNFYRNDMPLDDITSMTIDLLTDVGEPELNRRFIEERAGRGWCVAEIARSYARAFYPKGDRLRRQLLTALTRAGAPAGI